MNNHRKKILLVGGAGFLGSNLAKKLVQLRYKILIYDNFSSGSIENLRNIQKRIEIVRGDVLDFNKLHKTIRNFSPNIIFHLAALHYIPKCNEDTQRTVKINVEGTQNLLKAIFSFGICPYLIFISSGAVYTNSNKRLSESNLAKPIDIYGYTKFLGEQLVRKHCDNYKMPYVIVRLFNVYGYKDRIPHLIPEIVYQIKKKSRVIKLGDLKPKRDFIFIDDVINALVQLIKKQPRNIILNVGTGKEYSAKEIVKNIESFLDYKLEIRQNKNLFRKSERLHLCASNRKIKKVLNWKPYVYIKEALNILLKKEGIL